MARRLLTLASALGIALGLLLGAPALAQYAPQRGADELLTPEQEERVKALGERLRCPTCQGLSIADSPASTARAQLARIRDLVAEGKSDEEVVDYFVSRYGEWVLLTPTASGFNWVVWLGPVVLLLLGLGVIAQTLRAEPVVDAAAGVPENTWSTTEGNTTESCASDVPPPGSATAASDAGSTSEPAPGDGADPAAEDPYLRAVREELER